MSIPFTHSELISKQNLSIKNNKKCVHRTQVHQLFSLFGSRPITLLQQDYSTDKTLGANLSWLVNILLSFMTLFPIYAKKHNIKALLIDACTNAHAWTDKSKSISSPSPLKWGIKSFPNSDNVILLFLFQFFTLYNLKLDYLPL